MLFPWKKSYEKPKQHIKKQRHYFANKGLYSQSYIFSSNHIWLWELNHKEHWRTDAFELWCWRRLLRVPWTARLNQSVLKEISPGYSLEDLMLKLKLQCFGHLMWKDTDAEKDWRQQEKEPTEDKMVGWLTASVDMSLSKFLEMVKDREVWHAAVHGVSKSQTWLNNWTTTSL